jgi:hypothetical protein
MVPIKQTFVLVSFSLNVSDWNDFTLDFLPSLNFEEAKGVTQRELMSTLRMLFLRARVSRGDLWGKLTSFWKKNEKKF